jgi:hypothetical protein
MTAWRGFDGPDRPGPARSGSQGSRVIWTQAMLDVLHGGIEARDPMPRIAARAGVSEQSCFKKARQLGWLPGPCPRAGTRRADGRAGYP